MIDQVIEQCRVTRVSYEFSQSRSLLPRQYYQEMAVPMLIKPNLHDIGVNQLVT